MTVQPGLTAAWYPEHLVPDPGQPIYGATPIHDIPMHPQLPINAPFARTQHWPFFLRPARDDHDLSRVASFRACAYGRHLPQFAASLRCIEAADREPTAIVLLAQSHEDFRIVGSQRLHLGREHALPLEASLQLPPWLGADGPLIEPTRLTVEASEQGALARVALFKACFLYGRAAAAAWLVVAARRPLDRLYQRLLFRDVFEDGQARAMRHIGGLPHRVLALPLRGLPTMYRAQSHPLTSYMLDTRHPELIIDAARWSAPTPLAA